MRILISAGLYPPDIGGPSQYARNLYETWKAEGHDVKVAAYRWERAFPPGIRHLLFLSKVIRKGWNSDFILVLDTWSAAVPTMWACRLMGKKYVVRTGGDFLWESYVERTGDMVFFKDFYGTCLAKLSWKEKLVFKAARAIFKHASAVIFSTKWQKDIFERVHGLDPKKDFIVENFSGQLLDPVPELERTFAAWTRPLRWKNIDLLKDAFQDARTELKRHGMDDIELYTSKIMYGNSIDKMRRAWAVILVSIGDISPNMIYDALMTGTPFIVTRELGIVDRVKDAAIFVDPMDRADITAKIVWLSDPVNRAAQAEKVRKLGFTHSWEQVAHEILKAAGKDPQRP